MTDELKRPPLPWRVTRDISGKGDDEVYVPPAPDTERLPNIPPAPRVPAEPFRLLKGRAPSYVEFAAIVSHVEQGLIENRQRLIDVLSTQRKMSLQVDGMQAGMNQRFDIFHEELSLLRQTVSGDHAPRIGVVEKQVEKGLNPRKLAFDAGKYTGLVVLLALGARAVGKQFPQYYDVIDGVLGALGL